MIFRFNDFVSGPPLKLVKNLPHNCDISSQFIRRNRLICVFKSFVPKNEALGDHVILFEPKHSVNCTRHDFLTRQEKKEPVAHTTQCARSRVSCGVVFANLHPRANRSGSERGCGAALCGVPFHFHRDTRTQHRHAHAPPPPPPTPHTQHKAPLGFPLGLQ